MYWAWKNLKNVDVIGLCHYRRYFDFHKQCKWPYPITSFTTSQFKLLDFSIPQSVVDRILKGGIVVPRSVIYPIPLFYDYASCHIGSDMRIIQQIIEEKGDAKFINAFEDVMFRNNKLIHYNMFIMKWDDFNNYCNWLFPILKEAEKRIDISHYNVIQKRIWGYMAERLMNVWLYAEKKNLLFYPVIWINNNSSNMETRIKYLCRTLRYNLINKLATLQLTFKQSDMILELLFCLVLVLYLKWIFISMMYICEALNVFYIHHKTNVLCKMMAVPYHVIEYMLRYGGSRFVMFNIAEIPSVHFRRLLYKGLGAQIEKNVIMHFRTEIRGTYKLKIGEGTIIGDNALLDARSGLYIGKNVNLSSNVSI